MKLNLHEFFNPERKKLGLGRKTTEKLLNNDTMFIPLSDQLLKEQNILDNYGSQIINNL